MARLTKEQEREYAEEQEYYNENAPINVPGKARTSVFDKIVNAAKGTANKAAEFHQSPTGQRLQNWGHRVNAQEGLSGSPAPQRRKSQRGYAGPDPTGYARFSNDAANNNPPANQGSVVHPGNRLYVIQGSMIATGGGQKNTEEQRQRRRNTRPAVPGFGNDPGL